MITKAIQIKLLAAILAVLVIIAGLLIRGGRQIEIPRDTPAEKQFTQQFMPGKKPPPLIP